MILRFSILSVYSVGVAGLAANEFDLYKCGKLTNGTGGKRIRDKGKGLFPSSAA